LNPEKKQQLIKRLRYLWTWELADIFILPALGVIFAYSQGSQPGLMMLYSSVVLGMILWQGSAYWRTKLAAVQQETELDPTRLRAFKTWKRVNWIGLAFAPAVLAVKVWLVPGNPFDYDLFYGSMLYLLAVLEQINYYYVQLMYDFPQDWAELLRTRRLKKSSLRRALEKWAD
jgi:hypothetical protein